MNRPSAISLILAAALLASPAKASAPSHDVHELEKISFTVTAVGDRKSGSVIYLRTLASADSDGDGVPDERILRITCSGAAVTDAALWSRDASNAGRRGPGTGSALTGTWGAATPQFRTMSLAYAVEKVERARSKRPSSNALEWEPVALSGAEGLCPAAAAAREVATKSRSNIQNN